MFCPWNLIASPWLDGTASWLLKFQSTWIQMWLIEICWICILFQLLDCRTLGSNLFSLINFTAGAWLDGFDLGVFWVVWILVNRFQTTKKIIQSQNIYNMESIKHIDDQTLLEPFWTYLPLDSVGFFSWQSTNGLFWGTDFSSPNIEVMQHGFAFPTCIAGLLYWRGWW